ncbi:Chromatin remodeling factor mit1 [Hypsizygus marmoreus]|uniref:Chromatin remodeling factor mit1 n=1 Tax=Hypsizygus marmoreus TaxID=39966 RepID=A0A369KBP3_HYPMA|nr:Chromatin remodeling factor mit1 [Hypsizygus marmoreus]
MDTGDPSSDIGLLFTPEKSLGPVTSPPASPDPPPKAMKPGFHGKAFFVAPPSIPAAQKMLYKATKETSLKSEVEVPVDEVIGKYREGNMLYYFARYKGGIAHKFPSKVFEQKHKTLVEEFKRKEVAGELEPFDPSAHYIHPHSRVKTTINIRKGGVTTVRMRSARSIKSTPELEVVPDSQDEEMEDIDDEDESNDEEDDEDYDEDDISQPPRRSTRPSKQPLPFSPKKTRSRRVFVIDESDQEDEDSESVNRLPTRRSTRTRKGVKANLDLETYNDDFEPSGEDSDEYGSRSTRSKGRKLKKKAVRGKASRPAYGHFRAVAELDYDLDSDDEDASLRKHRDICEKCHQGPAHKLIQAYLKKGKGKKRRKTSDDEFEESDEEERLGALGGWVRCLKCPVVAHWRCMASTQRDEILKAARDRDRAEWQLAKTRTEGTGEAFDQPEPRKRSGLDARQTTEFICGACMKGGVCMGCMEVALEPDNRLAKTDVDSQSSAPGQGEDVIMADGTRDAAPMGSKKPLDPDASLDALVFRCFTCKRIAHYEHLPLPPTFSSSNTTAEIAQFYCQTWLCADCASYRDGVDKIIAWRPYPPNAVEPPRPRDEPPNYKASLPREYLVKWLDRSFRRVQWVPHMWLLSTHHAKLKHFLSGGTKVELIQEDEKMANNDAPTSVFEIGEESRASSVRPNTNTPILPQDAIPDAERRIPSAWKTVDRVLDVMLWRPRRQTKLNFRNKKGKQKASRIASDEDSDGDFQDSIEKERTLAFEQGEQPNGDLMETVSEWEKRKGREFSLDNTDQVVWAFFKWNDLGYDEATWDSPPLPEDPTYQAFRTALQRFIDSRLVIVPRHSQSYCDKFDKRAKDEYRTRHVLKNAADLKLGQNPQLKLMPFQVDGFNWLCNNWWTHQHCILADEMGLGKTVQVATFLGNIAMKFKAFPALVVVPNSTITNWVREFERWAPKLRVVPFYGEAKAREVIKKFELNHETKRTGETGAKFHVLITTYEALLNPKEFTTVFKNQPRWEVLVIDEGQRLKSDSSLLFKRLNELNSIHRIIMTGTPLNNNIRELFNLMNFLDPHEWNDLEGLEKEHEELTEDLVKQLHNRLRPYFLRRIKSEVLQLPPKNEVIVPVSMAPLQKEVYRSILSHNLELLNNLTTSKGNGAASKGRINNVLMQLRKCLQHPYLYAEDIEPRGLSPQETHEKLIDASAKLRFLKSLLPKLKERGHRVLLFSQFVIALNVIEDFLAGEGFKFLRLDGNTKGSERQKGMDEFNKPGSDVFIYLLTTRAGGVGINLFSADTVIIFDPDFNPHQDLQAIARAYRYGQQKTCLVFKLMVKDSAEERIVQVGKKKLVLDHLIVQKMDDEDSAGENVQSILTYGVKALFDANEESRDIVYTDHDIEKLVEKTEKEGEQQEPAKEGMSFAFAKIWAADKDSLEEVEDVDQGDSWAQTLQQITSERDKAQAQDIAASGRGVRRRAAAVAKPNAYLDGPLKNTLKKKSKTSQTPGSDGSAYLISDVESDGDGDGDVTSGATDDMAFEPPQRKARARPPSLPAGGEVNRVLNGPLSPIHNAPDVQYCGLCARKHGDGPGECVMMDRSENLAEYREMLLLHADDEPWDQRCAAIEAIDRTLHRRGHVALIAGQPLHPLQKLRTIDIPPAPAYHPTQKAPREIPRSSAPIEPGSSAPQSSGSSKHVSIPQRSGPSTAMGTSSSFVAGPSKLSSTSIPGPLKSSSKVSYASVAGPSKSLSASIAGPSKRPPSPSMMDEQSKMKKAKSSMSSASSAPCAVCGKTPHHLIKNCPLVAQGSQSISKQIKRLEGDSDPTAASTVRILHKLLSKQKKREEANSAIHIDLSDL